MNLRHILKVILVILGCALFAGAVIVGTQRLLTGEDESGPLERRAREAEARDLELLARKDAPAHEVYAALVRQGRRRVDGVREAAFERRAHSDPAIRAGVAEALGFFADPESLSVVRLLLSDPEPTVRVRALEGLGNHRDPARAVTVLKYLERPRLSDEEKVSAYSTLLRLGVEDTRRGEFAAQLVSIARSGDGAAETRAAFRAISQLPRDASVLAMIREKIEAGRNDRLVPVGIRHLAAVDDPWIAERSAALAAHKDPRIRLAIAQTLYRSCPKDRRQILETLVTGESNPLVFRAALRQLEHLAEEDSEDLLAKARKAQAGRKDILKELDDAAERPSKKEGDPCAAG